MYICLTNTIHCTQCTVRTVSRPVVRLAAYSNPVPSRRKGDVTLT